MTEKIELGATRDGFQIVGFVTKAHRPRITPWVVLVHQVGTDHLEYERFNRRLVSAGISTLAVDLRGHGDSVVRTSGRPKVADYRGFEPRDWQRCYRDVALAVKYGRAERAPFALLGAALGASAVIKAVARDAQLHDLPLVLLSPGLECRGVNVKDDWAQLRGAPILVVHAAYDGAAVAFRRWVVEGAADSTTRFLAVKSDGAKFISPILFVDGHTSIHDFSKAVKGSPDYPYEPTEKWVWYKSAEE
jgi:alpha-beta hydrolase superfamily lysophospholipase